MIKTIIRYRFRYRCPIRGKIIQPKLMLTRDQILESHPDAEILEDTAQLIEVDDSFVQGFGALINSVPGRE